MVLAPRIPVILAFRAEFQAFATFIVYFTQPFK